MANSWSSEEVANTICSTKGHNFGVGSGYPVITYKVEGQKEERPTIMCYACGLTLDEVRRDKKEN